MVPNENASIPSSFTHEVRQHIDSAINTEKRSIEDLKARIKQLRGCQNRKATKKESGDASKQLAASHALIKQWKHLEKNPLKCKLTFRDRSIVGQLDHANLHLAKQKMGRKEARNLSEHLCLRISELPPAAARLVERNLWLTLYSAIKADWVREDPQGREFWLLRAISRLDPANSAITDPFEAFLRDDFLAVRKGGGFVHEDGRIKISDARRGFSARMMERFVKSGIYEPTEDDIHHVFVSNLDSDNPQVRMAYRGILGHCAVKFSGILLDELQGINSSRQTSGIMSAFASCGWDAIPDGKRADAAFVFAELAANRNVSVSARFAEIEANLNVPVSARFAKIADRNVPVSARIDAAFMLSTLDPKMLAANGEEAKSVMSQLGETGAGITPGGKLAELRDMCAKAARNLNTDGAFVLKHARIFDLKTPGLQFILQNTDWQTFTPVSMVEMRLWLCNALLGPNPGVVATAAKILEAIGPNRTFGGKETGLCMDDTRIAVTALAYHAQEWRSDGNGKDATERTRAISALESAHKALSNPEAYTPAHAAVTSSRAMETAMRFLGLRGVKEIFGADAAAKIQTRHAKKPLPQKTG